MINFEENTKILSWTTTLDPETVGVRIGEDGRSSPDLSFDVFFCFRCRHRRRRQIRLWLIAARLTLIIYLRLVTRTFVTPRTRSNSLWQRLYACKSQIYFVSVGTRRNLIHKQIDKLRLKQNTEKCNIKECSLHLWYYTGMKISKLRMEMS